MSTRSQRPSRRFTSRPADLHVPFVIVDFVAPADVLRRRVDERRAAGFDASEADIHVLGHQLDIAEPIASGERGLTVTFDAGAPIDRSPQIESWQTVIDRLHVDAAMPH